MTTQRQLQHLYWRAGFGPRPQDVAAGGRVADAWRQLWQDARAYAPITLPAAALEEPQGALLATLGAPASTSPPSPAPLKAAGMVTDVAADMAATMAGAPTMGVPGAPVAMLPPRSALRLGRTGLPQLRRADLTPEQRKQQNQARREAFIGISTAWMDLMSDGAGALREKVALFWHGHFACRVREPADSLRLLNTIRERALGRFQDLLLAVSQEPAMLRFLNNQQNRKQHPNENFAREVMELFTLGRGNYSETDVKEAARAFTGWSADAGGNFRFREREHDAGPKTLLGQTGPWDGQAALRILLEQPAAATFLTTKVYRFFVSDQPDPARIAPLAAAFRASGYDIGDLLTRVFTAPWFYEPAGMGALVKSPVALVAGLRRTLNLRVTNERLLLDYQKALGQTLFMPPNVAGWPGGRAWIDSSSLLLRLQLPGILFKNNDFTLRLKDDDDVLPQVGGRARQLRAGLATRLPLVPLQALLGATPTPEQPRRLAAFLLQAPIRPENLALVEEAATHALTPETRLRTTLVSLLSLPEYQLC